MANELQLQAQIAALQAQLVALQGGVRPASDPLLEQRTALESEVSALQDKIKAYASTPRMMEIAQLLEQRERLQATLSALESIQVAPAG